MVALPYFLTVGFFLILLTMRPYRSDSPDTQLLFYPLISSIVATGGFTIFAYRSIQISRSSTAAIGYYFLPGYSLIAFFAAFLVSLSIFYVACFIIERWRDIPDKVTSAFPLVLAFFWLVVAGFFVLQQMH
jgi:hypothetical protein